MPRDDQAVQGILELHPKGFGFLRNPARNYAAQPADPYVPAPLIQRCGLRQGLLVDGATEAARKGSGPRLARIDHIEGLLPEKYTRRNFDDLTAIDPHEWIVLETQTDRLTTRVMDMLTPIGKGQRGLIVAPPRTGKTILLQHIAQAVVQNHPEMYLIMLLIDERPEEVTEMRRTIKGEVVASSSDRDSVEHARLAELVMERGKRLAEQGRQAFVLLDSITRLSRAYNKNVGNSGRTMSGGIDSRAMEVPRRLFGSARVFEEGGSLTVMATALIDTGFAHGRVHFSGIQGHRQHGTGAGPSPRRSPHFPGDGHQPIRHAQGGTPFGGGGSPADCPAASQSGEHASNGGDGGPGQAARKISLQRCLPGKGGKFRPVASRASAGMPSCQTQEPSTERSAGQEGSCDCS